MVAMEVSTGRNAVRWMNDVACWQHSKAMYRLRSGIYESERISESYLTVIWGRLATTQGGYIPKRRFTKE